MSEQLPAGNQGKRERGGDSAPRPPSRVTLTPPPRVGRPRADRSRGRRGRWLAGLWIGILGLGSVAVFALLPGWVESRFAGPAETAAASDDIPKTASSLATEASVAIPEPRAPRVASSEDGTEPAPAPRTTASRPASATLAPSPTPGAALPGSAPPQDSTGEVPATPRETATSPFAPLLTDALAALDRQEWPTAREFFQAVLDEAPEDSPEAAAARDGLKRADAGERRSAVADLRTRAEAAEATGRWADARDRWAELLDLDATLTAAREGRRRSAERARLAAGVGFHLSHPERLSAAEVRQEAETLARRTLDLTESAPEHPAPRLAEDARQLLDRVATWGRPVPAMLLSDAATRVTVHHVGRLGTFQSKVLSLTPGTYTVVGRRDGFRDVRREWVIRPGEEPEPLYVACEEEV